jgi:hydroxymethylbilane synthase
MNRIIVGTRGSMLARWQASFIAKALRHAHPDLVVEEKVIVTEGDRISAGPLWNVGGKGLWVKEIEAELLAGGIDLAVHSMKDVPGELAPGLAIAAIPARADVRDAVISRGGGKLDDLPRSARVGTTSLRRAFQLKVLRPDLDIQILRGNLDTRLRKVAEGVVDAAILACAGLDRLGLDDRIAERLPIERMLPAVGQGALAVETRADDQRTRALCGVLDHPDTAIAVTAERAFLARLGASCRTPVAGYARLQDGQQGGQVVLLGRIGNPDGTQTLAEQASGPLVKAAEVGRGMAETMLAHGAAALLGQPS